MPVCHDRSADLLPQHAHPTRKGAALFQQQVSRVSEVNNVMCDMEEVMLQGLVCCDALLRLVLQQLVQQVAQGVNVRLH